MCLKLTPCFNLNMLPKMSPYVILCALLINLYSCSDVFHEGSKITFYPNNPASYFGYTVALSDSGLIVGAPKANTTGPVSTAAGVVFNCPLRNLDSGNVSCSPLELNIGDRNFFKNGMLFGASLSVGPTGKMVICAPRHARLYFKGTYVLLNGACYLRMKNLETLLLPLNSNSRISFKSNETRNSYSEFDGKYKTASMNYYAYAQAGISAKVTEDRIIIGAPGLLEWSGGIVQYTYGSDVESKIYSQKPTFNPFFTNSFHPNDYFGYSVESCVFEDGGKSLYVTGGPRGNQGLGMVLVFEPATDEASPLNILAKVEGPQLGSYFGASLACLDVNADGRIDLLVGAPNYVKQFPKDDLYDQGAVFVYLNKEWARGFILDYDMTVTGSEVNGAKFGYSIANLGDIDGDGYNDVAIGAPWENDGAGALYIYKGNKIGLTRQHVQRIVQNEARGFGLALTRGHDVDNNKCNDLVIGAPETGATFVYRCIPTVKVQATITVPGALSLTLDTSNFTAQFCVSVLPLSVTPGAIVMELQATLTVDPEGNRTTIIGDSKYKLVTGATSVENCQDRVVEIKNGSDMSKPIPIIFDVESVDRMQENSTTFRKDAGRVSEDSVLHSTVDIQLVKECGTDLICRPWLEMTLESMSNPYIPGADGRLGAVVRVLSKEEPAFGISVRLTLPSVPKRVPTACSLRELILTCDLPSPLNQNDTAEWEVEFEYTPYMRETGAATMHAVIVDPVLDRVISVEPSQYLEIIVTPVANINAIGNVLPDATISVSREKLDRGGYITFTHFFQVTNAGPSDWPNLMANVHVSTEKVLLLEDITGCHYIQPLFTSPPGEGALALPCVWSVKANQSLSIVLPLRYDLTANGKSLEADSTSNVTSTLFLNEQHIIISITTSLVLEPAPLLWIAYTVGVVVGLILLSLLTYGAHKWGFFSRSRHPEPKTNGTHLEELCSASYVPLEATTSNGSVSEDRAKPSYFDSDQSCSGSTSDMQSVPLLTPEFPGAVANGC